MNRHAYVVGFLDKRILQFVGAGVFSEETPTVRSTLHPFTILAVRGESYEDALCNLHDVITDVQGSYHWVYQIIPPSARESMERTAARKKP